MNIKISNNKKMILFISIISLAGICLLIPTTLSYGDDFHNAQTITNGTYDDILDAADDFAFYKIYSVAGDYLEAIITCAHHIGMYLFDPGYYQVGYRGTPDWGGDSPPLYYVVTGEGFHYIRVSRDITEPGDTPFSLEISGATGPAGSPAIPGFELITLLVVIVSISGLIYLQRKRQLNKII